MQQNNQDDLSNINFSLKNNADQNPNANINSIADLYSTGLNGVKIQQLRNLKNVDIITREFGIDTEDIDNIKLNSIPENQKPKSNNFSDSDLPLSKNYNSQARIENYDEDDEQYDDQMCNLEMESENRNSSIFQDMINRQIDKN